MVKGACKICGFYNIETEPFSNLTKAQRKKCNRMLQTKQYLMFCRDCGIRIRQNITVCNLPYRLAVIKVASLALTEYTRAYKKGWRQQQISYDTRFYFRGLKKI